MSIRMTNSRILHQGLKMPLLLKIRQEWPSSQWARQQKNLKMKEVIVMNRQLRLQFHLKIRYELMASEGTWSMAYAHQHQIGREVAALHRTRIWAHRRSRESRPCKMWTFRTSIPLVSLIRRKIPCRAPPSKFCRESRSESEGPAGEAKKVLLRTSNPVLTVGLTMTLSQPRQLP